MRFDTLLVHSGQRTAGGPGDLVPPIHVAVTYERNAHEPQQYYYGRGENPTREALEEALAALEEAPFATVFASGQAAAATVLALLRSGQRVVANDDLYSGTSALLALADAAGVTVDLVDLSAPARVTEALGSSAPPPDLVWVETPTNPLLKVVDLDLVCRLAHARGALVLVDNTLAGPVLQQPLRSADVTLYSTTKSISGHHDVLGGALVYRDDELHRRVRAHRTIVGNVPGAIDCYLVRRGLKTLSLRVARQCESATAVVAALRAETSVAAVRYPGFGSVVAFEYLGNTDKLLEHVQLFAPAVSLGGVQSLIECPASMSHASVPRHVLAAAGVTERLVRLSIGIEDVADLVEDLCGALQQAWP